SANPAFQRAFNQTLEATHFDPVIARQVAIPRLVPEVPAVSDGAEVEIAAIVVVPAAVSPEMAVQANVAMAMVILEIMLNAVDPLLLDLLDRILVQLRLVVAQHG